MKSSLKVLLAGALLSFGTTAFAGTTEIGSGTLTIKCRADVSALAQQEFYINVEMKQTAEGKLSANVNGVTYNSNIQSVEHSISKQALSASLEGSDIDKLNDGERRLVHLKSMADDPTFGGMIKVSFDLTQIAKVRAYDLEGDSSTNKFGGIVLLEAFDSNGVLLGRIVSSMFPGQCL